MRKSYLLRIFQLIFGIFICAFGIVVTINANIGYAPWDVFHVGFSKTTGVSIGNVVIIIGIIIVILSIFLGEKFGIGTIFNMIFIGVFLDIIISLHIIPIASNVLLGISMLIIGLFILAVGTYFYMKSMLGAGPRDSLMIVLTRKTGLPIGVCRSTIEILAVFVGWKLGGMVGIGTILAAFTIGFWIQLTFRLFKFDVTEIKHETIEHTYKMIFNKNN